jgi:peptidoglycan-associated lipoprotein
MHSRSHVHIYCATAVLIGSLFLAGCPKRPEITQAPPAPTGPAVMAPASIPPAAQLGPPTAEAQVTQATPSVETSIAQGAPSVQTQSSLAPGAVSLTDVFFAYDSSAIRPDQQAGLNKVAGWLKTNAQAPVRIEGSCDERGTSEYNLALGERRAKAVKDYLLATGVAADRIATISYGKERPYAPGHDENAWQLNRRGHFVVQGQ